MTKKKLKIGLLGASKIAPRAIMTPCENINTIEIHGIAASSLKKAQDFADQYNIPFYTGSYHELMLNDEIDAIYIGLKNDMHYQHALDAIRNKKHVLVEKPLCLSYSEFAEIKNLGLKNNVIVMEAIMVEHHPWQAKIAELLEKKIYGNVVKLTSNIKYELQDKTDFRYAAEHGGGAYYDIGCYSLQFIQQAIGLDFQSIECFVNETGKNKNTIDFTAKCITHNGVQIEINCSFTKPSEARHIIECERGLIEVKNWFRAGFGYNKMYIHCTNKNTGVTEKISFEPMNFYHNQLVNFSERINRNAFPTEHLDACGERIRLIEVFQTVQKKA